MVKITNRHLETYIAAAVLVEMLFCTAYSVMHQIQGGVEESYIDEYQITEWQCSQDSTVQYINIANFMYIMGLLLILCIFAFKYVQYSVSLSLFRNRYTLHTE